MILGIRKERNRSILDVCENFTLEYNAEAAEKIA